MAESKISKRIRFVDRTITTGSNTYDGHYFADDSTYTADNAISAQVVGTTDNRLAFTTMFSWTTRVWTIDPNTEVTVRYLLK